jgi:flagellar hook assembly protein FlgD
MMKIFLPQKLVFIIILLLIFPVLVFALGAVTATVSPDSTNQYGAYTISSGLSAPFPLRQVEANIDSLVVVFNGSTVLPASIDPSLITVNGVTSSGATVSGQSVYILSPVELRNFLGGTSNFTIVIAAAAKIRNPATSGSYTLGVEAINSTGSTIDGPATSSAYSIYTVNSVVSITAVAPNPAVAGQAAAYSIAFSTGTGGYLTGGSSTITVGFDTNTVIADGALSGVTVNGTSATATANNDTVVITTPVDIDNEGSASVNFSLGSGVTNPSSGGNYTLGVKTSSETTYVVSDSFHVAAAGEFTISAVTINPTTVNTAAEYDIQFITSSSGALAANTDTVTIIFEQNTLLPNGVSTSDVVVSAGGFSDNAAAVLVMNENATDDDTLRVVMPISAGNTTTVGITISSTSGLLNPSQSDRYTIDLYTTADTGMITSNSFQITGTTTTVSEASVVPGATGTGAVTSYEVDFNLGAKGRLQPAVSTITLTFHSGYTLSTTAANYNNSTISVAVGTAVSIPTANIAVDNTAKTLTITVPTSVETSNGDNIVLIIDGTTTNPITNPGTSGNYTLGVKTSVETTQINSYTYTIGGTAVTYNTLSLGDSTVNNASAYTINFTSTTAMNELVDDYIQVVFPEGTVVPASIATGNITINGANPNAVTIVQSTRTVKAAISQFFIGGGTNITVVFSAAANIVNPPVPNASFYKAIISTSKDIAPVNTRTYEISGDATQVTSVSASANPGVRGASNVAHTISFTTSATGKLAGGTAAGSSTVTVAFDTITVVPASIAPSSVKINSTTVPQVSVLSSGNGGIVRFTLPEDMTIGNSTSATINFQTTTGLATRNYSGTFQMQVKTSSDTTYSDTTGTAGDYSITDTQSLSISSVTPNPSVQNAAAGYSVSFTTGSLGALAAGDSIRLVFPANTFLPAAVSKSDFAVNGSNPDFNPGVDVDTLTIRVPSAIGDLTAVTVLINQAAGILNPTLIGSYTLKVITSAETGPFTSPSYNITQTSTTVSTADVSPSPVTPGADADYAIAFNVGSRGRLLAGTSTVTITFNAQTTVSTTVSEYDASSITVDGSSMAIPTGNISISSKAVTFTVPAGVSVDNNDGVSVTLAGAGANTPIQNPGSTGSYTLQVKTSVETSNITSNSFTITSASAVTGIMADINPAEVNAESADTVSFRIQNTLTAPGATITITFPSNTLVPATMSTSTVRIANDGSDPATFGNVAGISTNSSTRTVTITIPSTIPANDSVKVAFLTAAGLENPSITGNYTLQARTSAQNINGTSAAYSLSASPTTILNFSVDIIPALPSVNGQYTFSFTTGMQGRLVSGTSKIYLLLPEDASFTQGVPSLSKVRVNNTTAQSLSLISGAGSNPDTLAVTVPSSVTIGNSANVTVVIDSTAGLQNASTGSALNYQAFTSVETSSQNYDFSLPVQLTSFKVRNEAGINYLEWITESELENAYWMLDRKSLSKEEYKKIQDGLSHVESAGSVFTTIAYLDGQGSVSLETRYAYKDSLVQVGMVYAYRLADVSYNGLVTNHEIIFQEVSAPSEFVMYNNYPNPFNPSTTVKYSLPIDARVELKIYNVLGQEIITLADDLQKAGFHQLQWNGKNSVGQAVASGMYIVAFRANGAGGSTFTKMMKILLLK